jgi:hypothetical protein
MASPRPPDGPSSRSEFFVVAKFAKVAKLEKSFEFCDQWAHVRNVEFVERCAVLNSNGCVAVSQGGRSATQSAHSWRRTTRLQPLLVRSSKVAKYERSFEFCDQLAYMRNVKFVEMCAVLNSNGCVAVSQGGSCAAQSTQLYKKNDSLAAVGRSFLAFGSPLRAVAHAAFGHALAIGASIGSAWELREKGGIAVGRGDSALRPVGQKGWLRRGLPDGPLAAVVVIGLRSC